MQAEEIIQKIKSRNWDNRVQRPGFFQSKQIVVEAKSHRLHLTKSASVLDSDNIWIKNSAAYNQDVADELFSTIFPLAFNEDKDWPVKIVEELDNFTGEKDVFVSKMKDTDWSKESEETKTLYLKKYVNLLFDIQKYYAFAVPLTNYCEKIIKEKDSSLLRYAVQYKELDVDMMNASLFKIKQSINSGLEIEDLIQKHLENFAWIKTNYNIVEKYTKEEILNEIKSNVQEFKKEEIPDGQYKHIVVALQCGIYLRNRMKEMSQQLWFYYDNLAIQMAKDLGITREDFLQLHYKEVLESFKEGSLTVSQEEIRERHQGFICGILDAEEFLLTGQIVDKFFNEFNSVNITGIKEIKGNTACKGVVVGKAKLILKISDSHKLNQGDILVTSMTTPDFVVIMKKAGAIVTDEGGLSCHAAIVSRELKIPCVIGTKVATKVLKDGMQIEVDATNGVVKIL